MFICAFYYQIFIAYLEKFIVTFNNNVVNLATHVIEMEQQ